MKEGLREFAIDVVNAAVLKGILETWCNVKKNSHNRFAGLVTIWFDEQDDNDGHHELHKITPAIVFEAIDDLCNKSIEGLDEEIEKKILLARKRLDASVLDEPEDVLAIFQYAIFGEVG